MFKLLASIDLKIVKCVFTILIIIIVHVIILNRGEKMKKIIGGLFSILFLMLIGTVLVLSYKDLKPQQQLAKAAVPQSINLKSEEIDFKNLESQLLNEDGIYYLWFCDNEDSNCSYVENEFIVPMLNRLNIDKFENMHKVNFTDCPYSKQKLLEKYNVDSTLAFVKVEVEGDAINYSDGITWTSDDNFNFEDLQKWLYSHNIWQEAYESVSKKAD